ncbi:uncharacterized protein LOC114348105 isoform X2 [Diabrotica virgifera virgifera]|uniref:CHK kinase-like domain-containing protein n=1 Tax=Diabrotica virgifera virgifera TaxID=50390 RepID=A0ABM5KMA9_DIAVI|nr:uncharacterized protein LOC114348105 isoform X2 [Diabrotica virgifera virgifera]XP_050511293.1 uncharacterized protein LOC114348105 isoform X2 [Diabrotica virgifera virgifera]
MSVKNIETLLELHIGEGKKIKETQTTNLVNPGENYGGELFKIDVTLEDSDTQKEEVLHIVGKIIPADDNSQEIFNVQNTFKSEIGFYEKIVPALQNFQRKHKIEEILDIFPKFYGSRINLDGSDKVDRDGVLLLENLKIEGYDNLDRYIGYNLEDAKILLRDLAVFQSTVVALKIKQPDVFNKEIKPFCNNNLATPEDDPFRNMILVIDEILEDSEEFRPFIPKVNVAWDKQEMKTEVREPFATIVHRDLWVNNVMIKYEKGKPAKNKFIDFQLYDYGSPASDVLNFIFTSVKTEVSRLYFDDLVEHYHTEFVNNLKRFKCDTEPFNYPNFLRELKMESEIILGWTIGFVTLVIFGKKNKSFMDDPLPDFQDPKYRQKVRDGLMPEALERLFFILRQCHRCNWI